jgi:uncharacterized integral membrane protein
MRLLSIVMTILLIVGFLGFVVTNLDTRVGITVWKTHYPHISLHLIVFLAMLAGAVYAGIIGVYQGVQMWVVNRRLSREIQRLENELNDLRTQPPARRGQESESAEGRDRPGQEPPTLEDPERAVPSSAPVYGDGDDSDFEDDTYSGGRAV